MTFFGDAHSDVHAEEGIAGTREGPPQWQNMFRGPGDGDTNQVAVPHNTIGRIEIDPAGARQVSLHPSVSGTAARDACIVARNKDIPADEASGHAKRSRRFHHEDGEVPATSATALDCFVRALNALLDAPGVLELFPDP